MTDNSAGLHESAKQLKPETIDRHRAVVSIMEELEAVDWYDQRVDAAGDAELRQLLAHNRDEEKEHASMMIEWLRRHDPKLDEHLRTYLFTKGNLMDIERAAEHGGGEAGSSAAPGGKGAPAGDGSLGIGSLKKWIVRGICGRPFLT
jgi:ferritin-like protein